MKEDDTYIVNHHVKNIAAVSPSISELCILWFIQLHKVLQMSLEVAPPNPKPDVFQSHLRRVIVDNFPPFRDVLLGETVIWKVTGQKQSTLLKRLAYGGDSEADLWHYEVVWFVSVDRRWRSGSSVDKARKETHLDCTPAALNIKPASTKQDMRGVYK